jgi:predicted NAD/FAD-binding protein
VRIAIIGGGASGVVAAHLLGGFHHVTLIERQPVLGGNIRTLNRNAPCPALAPGLHLDAGVIEFERDRFPAFHALMEELGVELGEVPGTSGLFLADGRSFLSADNVRMTTHGAVERIWTLARMLPLALSRRRFLRRAGAASPAELAAAPLSAYLDGSVFSLWLRLLVMYAYSIPAPAAGDVPAALAVPVLRDFLGTCRWSRVKGGVYVYIERILERFTGDVLLEARVARVRRLADRVEVEMADAETLRFDAVVFATTPDQVLALLADPSDAETRRFAAWEPQPATTVVHTDDGLHRRRGIRYPSEFDLVQTVSGTYGYNAYLNRLSGLGGTDGPGRTDELREMNGLGNEGTLPYQLAFNMGEEIDPRRVLHTQEHTTPRYTVAAFRHRDEVIATNGENRTFHAGAYLGDGLHEGAVRSASSVSGLLGGREIRFRPAPR